MQIFKIAINTCYQSEAHKKAIEGAHRHRASEVRKSHVGYKKKCLAYGFRYYFLNVLIIFSCFEKVS